MRECPAFNKKCHKCGHKIISAVVGQNKRATEMATIKDHPNTRAQRDITDLEADAPDRDPEVDPTHKVHTASSSTMTRYNRKVCKKDIQYYLQI